MVQRKKGIPTGELQLKFSDQLLEDGHTLNEYNIQNVATVTYNYGTGKVVVHLCSGCKSLPTALTHA